MVAHLTYGTLRACHLSPLYTPQLTGVAQIQAPSSDNILNTANGLMNGPNYSDVVTTTQIIT